jgi:hypothetical protein
MVPTKDHPAVSGTYSPDEASVEERGEEEPDIELWWKKQAVVDFTPSLRRDT